MDDIAEKLQANRARIKVIGVGGGGVNAVNNMISSGLVGVEFYAANTDARSLVSSLVPEENKIQLGEELTGTLGAGADPDVGQAAARESADAIRAALEGANMVFVTCGMGGGTGTLGSGVAAEIARELGCLTVGVVTKPFNFEGKRRMRNAERGIEEMRKHVDSLITIPNQRLLSISGRNTCLLDAFKKADDVLYKAVMGISDLILKDGLVNVDFNDVKTVMSVRGLAMLGTGEASGENRAEEAARKAISSPLLEDVSIQGSKAILINITGSSNVTLLEINEAAEIIEAEAHADDNDDVNVIWGMVIDEDAGDTLRITVIATGFGEGDAIVASPTPTSPVSNNASADHRWFGGKTTVNPFSKADKQAGGRVVDLGKTTVLSDATDSPKYEIPPFLRKQME